LSTETKTRVAWQWCCQQPQFTRRQLQDAAEMTMSYSNQVVRAWSRAGIIERVGHGSRAPLYRVINPDSPPLLGMGSNQTGRRRSWRKTQQQKMWNSMLINNSFGLSDLIITSDVLLQSAYTYVNQLARAGYIKIVHRMQRKHVRPHEREPSRYQLVRDTGRFAPIIRPNGCWDQNEQRLYPFLTEESDHGRVA